MHQKQMGENGLQHMVMPALPSARFKIIQSGFSLAFFKSCLHMPSHTDNTGQFQLGTFLGRVTQVKLGFRLQTKRATEDRPATRPRQPFADLRHADKSQLNHDGTFAAFLDLSSMPGSSGQLSHQSSHFKRSRGAQLYAWINARTPRWARSGRFDRRGTQPDAVSEGTSARYHLSRAAISSKNTGVFP